MDDPNGEYIEKGVENFVLFNPIGKSTNRNPVDLQNRVFLFLNSLVEQPFSEGFLYKGDSRFY